MIGSKTVELENLDGTNTPFKSTTTVDRLKIYVPADNSVEDDDSDDSVDDSVDLADNSVDANDGVLVLE